MEAFIIGYIGLVGLLIGSFLNVVIYRLPHGETIVSGRSHCPACNHNLSSLDLVPVFSFLFLGRRCRYCKSPISWRYMIIELSAGIFFALAAWVIHPLDGLVPALLMANACALFCVLLADSLIQYDGHTSQTKKMTVIALALACGPLLTGLFLRDPGLTALADRVTGLAVGLVLMLLPMRIRLAGRHAAIGTWPWVPALPAAGLFLGVKTALPVLAAGLVLGLVLLVTGSTRRDPSGIYARRLHRLLPLLVLITFVATLFLS